MIYVCRAKLKRVQEVVADPDSSWSFTDDYLRPDLPAFVDAAEAARGHVWSQVEDRVKVGHAAVWVDCPTLTEVGQLSTHPGIARVTALDGQDNPNRLTSKQMGDILGTLRQGSGATGQKQAVGDLRRAFKLAALAEKDLEVAAIKAATLKSLLLPFGIIAAGLTAQYLAQLVGVHGGEILPFLGATLASDSFDRADADLDGSSTEVGGFTWDSSNESTANPWTIVGNEARTTGVGDENVAFLSDMTNTADVTVSETTTGTSSFLNGPCGRLGATPYDDYYLFEGRSTKSNLRKGVAGVVTQLGSNGGVVGTFDVLKLDLAGTSLEGFLNGGSEVTATDSAHSTGKVGIMARAGGSYDFNNFLYEGTASGGSVYRRTNTLLRM